MERIRVMNTYVGNQLGHRVKEWLESDRINIGIISEIDDLWKWLDDIGRVVKDDSERQHDCAILVRGKKRIERMKVTVKRVTPFIKREGDKPMLWRDRWIVRVEIGRKVYYSVHANAAIAGPEGRFFDNKGAEAWIDAMKWLHDRIVEDKGNNKLVRIGGDFNQQANEDVRWNPAWLFDRLGLRYFDDGRVMYLAWDPRDTKVVKREVTAKVPGADAHESLTLFLEDVA